MTFRTVSIALFASFFQVALAQAQDPTEPVQWDPATIDQLPASEDFPPTVLPIAIASGSAQLHGSVLVADGEGPHATVLMLRDFPGWASNADVGYALRRAGYNVAMIDYRGTGSSGGAFSWQGAGEDVRAIIEFFQTGAGPEYRADPQRIHFVGDGFGAWAALVGSDYKRGLEGCLASLGFWNPGAAGRLLAGGDSRIRDLIDGSTDPQNGPIRADPAQLAATLAEQGQRLDVSAFTGGIRGSSVLFLSAPAAEAFAEQQTLMAAAIFSGGGPASVERSMLADDPEFSSARVRLSRLVVSWFEQRCPAW